MKLLLALTLSLCATTTALACPGSGTRSLTVKGVEIARLNYVGGPSIEVLAPNARLTWATWQASADDGNIVGICGIDSDGGCSNPQAIATSLTAAPMSIVNLEIRMGRRNYSFSTTNFRVYRGGCGGSVEGQ